MNKAVFLDRDGTINKDKDYLCRIEDFEYLPGAIDALKILQQAGFLLIIITNQSGIARGFYREEDFFTLNDWMIEDLKDKGVNISNVYYCPHHPQAKIEEFRKDCECRKPKTGLFEQAIHDFDIDLSKSYAIGDKIRDCAICEKSECKGFLISDLERPNIIDEVIKRTHKNIVYKVNLYEAARAIVEGE